MFGVKTAILQDMVAKSVKGSSDNKLIPLTGLMCIQLKNNVLTLITTDATNYLYITENKVEGEDFYVVIPAVTFSTLIARMTCDSVSLKVEDSILEIKGNGTYKIELPLDENGQPIKYPDPLQKFDFKKAEEGQIKSSTVQVLLNTLKPALATTLEIPCYTGYYMGKRVVATDTYKIASLDSKLFTDPKLVSPEMINLVSIMSDEQITVNIKDNIIVYSTPSCTVYGPTMEGIEDYAIDPITDLIDLEFYNVCKLPKTTFLQLLDRLALFVGVYDKNGVDLVFTESGVVVSSKAGSGTELIPYIESKNPKNFSCTVDIQMLTQQVKSIQSDVLELYYGLDNAIKFVDGNITVVLALLEDE